MGVGIQVEHLNAWYGKNHTLQDINLPIPANQATALIGPSGCGKSTFVRCLNRMHETIAGARAEGSVRIGDMDVYKDLLDHGLLELLPNLVTHGLTNPIDILALRWLDASDDEQTPFDPGYLVV